ncbi:MAG: YraN family protein [Geopsychrobacter sp.]|nr:YraN family protein [Geopsychrobacter sp.]
MTQARLNLGAWGENQAVAYLQRQGRMIVARNFTTPVGEVDIIASSKKELIFIEVKTRRTNAYGTPAEAVGVRKQRQIIRTAQWYLTAHKSRLQPRFDVIGVMPDDEGGAHIEHLTAAFDLT